MVLLLTPSVSLRRLAQRWRRAAALLTLLSCSTVAAPAAAVLHPCRVEGIATELQCGVLQRPLDPGRPDGVKIDLHYLVVPAMARNKLQDPVLLLAGGPGQSAIQLAPVVLPLLARLNNRRDLVFIDQRGTGQSAPLQCPDRSRGKLDESIDDTAQAGWMLRCQQALTQLPYGDMRYFTTTIAMQDMDAVRAQLGAVQWNLVGASYGTRAALEYLRLFPKQVRRTLIAGVAPPDMVLPRSMSTDMQNALDAVLQGCEQDAGCAQRFPHLRKTWDDLLRSLPRKVTVTHPITGVPEQFTLTREQVLRTVRMPLYAPPSASGLPAAIDAAGQGRFEGLMGLSGSTSLSKNTRLAVGMHFSVICAEDAPLLEQSEGTAPRGRDFGSSDADLYKQVCKTWPRGEVPAEFYKIPPAPTPVLLLSGSADPVTPPRHGERMAKALGAQARHIVVPESGHSVLNTPCMRDVLFRFIDSKQDADALAVDADCAMKMPRPGFFSLPQPRVEPAASKVTP